MRNKEVWPFIFLVGLLLFNWPMVNLFEAVLPYYLYITWSCFILAIGLLAGLRNRPEKK